ncbi:HPP family protein [Acinetobacter stercoris]|uniref:HPP family protein n=1 Tax=Acinetobacter stercoris TaxID=2126983 RepID=A0A2U3MY61_9GAMM|nr:HPP family protein [Acinetobacter stercoris]SPL70372.1 HPP family protein [Acinetobacter stercoris]
MSLLSGKEKLAPIPSFNTIIRGFWGGSISIFILLILGKLTNHLWIMAPFGATCVILYTVAQSPLAQPRNVIFGHFISAFIGMCFLKIFGVNFLSIAFSVGGAIALMQFFRCVHPPAGANPLVILLTANTFHYEWSFLALPVLLGAIVLVLVAYCVNNFKTESKWPTYGLALWKSKSE